MTHTPTITWCHTRTIAIPVHDTCAALDWLCARSKGSPNRPDRWAYPVPTLPLTFQRRTRHGPPERPRYAPYRQLDGHLHRRSPWPLPIQLEIYPWDPARTELSLRPHFHRDLPLAQFSQLAAAVLDDLTARLRQIIATNNEDELDAAALTLLLDDN